MSAPKSFLFFITSVDKIYPYCFLEQLMKDSKLSISSNKLSSKCFVFRVTAYIKQLKIQVNSLSETQVLWKRHHQKSQTKLCNHSHGFTTFNQQLSLLIDLEYDSSKQDFCCDIQTELVAVIIVDGKAKSGGYAKIDVANVLNNKHSQPNEQNTIVSLSGCPDPDGYVELKLSYEQQSQGTIDEMSMWNASSRDFNMSKVDISDYQQQQARDIQTTVNKIKDLTRKIKESKENEGQAGVYQQQKIEMIQGENTQLRLTVKDLETKLQQKEQKWKTEKLENQKQISSLQRTIEKKSKQFNEKVKQLSLVSPQNKSSNIEYQDKLKDLRRDSFDTENEKNPFESSSFGNKSSILIQQKLFGLEKQKQELEVKVAEMSVCIGKLFNAALEIGGPQLLDRLQQSMDLQEGK